MSMRALSRGTNKRLQHSENQMDEGNHAVNVKAATINQSNEVTSFFQIVPVSIQSDSNKLNTCAFRDNGSTVSFIDQNMQEKLRAQGPYVTLNMAGLHGTKYLKIEKVPPKKVTTFKGEFNRSVCLPVNLISLGNTNYSYSKLNQIFNHFSVLTNESFNLIEVGIILGQDAYELQSPLDYKIEIRTEPFAVLTELGWVVSGPMIVKRRQNFCHYAFTEDVKVVENLKTWWDIENYVAKIIAVSHSVKERTEVTKDAGEYEEVYRRAVRSGNAAK